MTCFIHRVVCAPLWVSAVTMSLGCASEEVSRSTEAARQDAETKTPPITVKEFCQQVTEHAEQHAWNVEVLQSPKACEALMGNKMTGFRQQCGDVSSQEILKAFDACRTAHTDKNEFQQCLEDLQKKGIDDLCPSRRSSGNGVERPSPSLEQETSSSELEEAPAD